MAWFYRSIIGVAVGFLVIVWGGECVTNTRLLALVDEWIPVFTGMTAGGADQFSHLVILANAGIHPSAPAITNVDHNNPSNLRSLSLKTKKPTLFQVLA
ncbi:hypothetical protein ACRTC9_15310 [Vibrio vulnificus]|uniref:hypothetical protein n=1 Tax=Vibrio vulnificus TaxID=672 RepID=UPI003D7D9AFF